MQQGILLHADTNFSTRILEKRLTSFYHLNKNLPSLGASQTFRYTEINPKRIQMEAKQNHLQLSTFHMRWNLFSTIRRATSEQEIWRGWELRWMICSFWGGAFSDNDGWCWIWNSAGSNGPGWWCRLTSTVWSTSSHSIYVYIQFRGLDQTVWCLSTSVYVLSK